ncbi:MAG: hypothetical protein PHO89_05330 [Methylacidiphilaceae bacterium]|nr:hypothetical protein [Candidatus Methylacidiphilaceae bacterium]
MRSPTLRQTPQTSLTAESIRKCWKEFQSLNQEPGSEEDAGLLDAGHLLEEGDRRYQEAASQKAPCNPCVGFFEAACVVKPPLSGDRANTQLLARLMAVHPGLRDWPLWFDTRRHPESGAHPYVKGEAWECWINSPPAPLQFWTIAPQGHFYVKASFEEDKEDTGTEANPPPELQAGVVDK